MPSNEQREQLARARVELEKELFQVINRWMDREICHQEPEAAIGIALAATAQASAEYAATYAVLHRASDEWGMIAMNGQAQSFANRYLSQIDYLRKEMNLAQGEPPEVC